MTALQRNWNALQRQIVACEACPRLRAHCTQTGRDKRRSYAGWDYWARPVPNLGELPARLLILGLAPAAHGANRTGRMFTGDRSGEWLFRALHKAGFANQPHSERVDDGLRLIDCVITATCHCAPPGNLPTIEEIVNCRQHLRATFDLVQPRVILALGQIGWKGALDQLRDQGWQTGRLPKFGHGAVAPLAAGRWLVGSYHPSQQNTFTGKLTEPMFDAVFVAIKGLLEGSGRGLVPTRRGPDRSLPSTA
ncbi:MAG: uracil-DNA glycosylase [Pirellulaceae bacterium]